MRHGYAGRKRYQERSVVTINAAAMVPKNPLSRRVGPDLNRDTMGNVQQAGFRLRREENVYLDIVKIIEAVND